MEDFVAFVCLANSRKNHDRCVAGIDLETGNWVRLVRDRRGSALQYRQVCYIEGEELEPLDIAAVMIAHKAPLYFQPENVVIDNTCSMFWHGKMPVDKLDNYCTKETYLWGDNSDRIPAADLEQYAGRPGYPGSLQLIKVNDIGIEKMWYSGKYHLRAIFNYKGNIYNLAITDPLLERVFLIPGVPAKRYLFPYNCYLTVSLGECFGGYHYKLVAAVIACGRDGKVIELQP